MTSPTLASTTSTTAPTHIPGLTGLRGVAVTAVVAYHLGYLPGGFLGVDVFFVLSGFLITSLLLKSAPESPRQLARWWGRRFRRLTPAVAVVVIAVLAVFATMSGIVTDAVATLTWWQNWHLIIEGKPYWASSPSPLRHAWSLSIEEQFYAFWPLTLIVSLKLGRRVRRSRPETVVAAVALGGAAASFGWGFWRALTDTGTLSRIYFGSDTRIGTLLLGCAMASLVHGRSIEVPRRVVNAGAVLATVGLGALTVLATPERRWTYTGGLLAAAILSLILVISSTKEGPFATLLARAPLQWLGTHSYALYLWSWPTQVLVQERLPDLSLPVVALITVATSVVLSDLSLRWVENPLRRQQSWATRARPRLAAYACGVAVIAALLVFAGNSSRPDPVEKVARQFEKMPDPTTTASTTCPPAPTTTVPGIGTRTDKFDPDTVAQGADPSSVRCGGARPTRVLVVGDSLGRGAANGLRRLADPGLEVWDRTNLGCGMKPPTDGCPDLNDLWPRSVARIQPDVVMAYMGTAVDIVPGDDPDFMSTEASVGRRNVLVGAMKMLAAGDARVIWALPAVPLESGVFYCEGKHLDSACDPTWVARWREDVLAAAALTRTSTVDVQAWVDRRPTERARTDRPDGLHLSGPALEAHAAWLNDQIRELVPPQK